MSPTALCLGLCFALLVSYASGACNNPYKRKEYRDTTDEEWDLFREALFTLQNRGGSQSGWSMYDDFTNFHRAYASQTHSTLLFLPWHRAFLLLLEQRLRSLAPKFANVFIPYWSWSSDSSPMRTPLFSKNSRFHYDVAINQPDCDFVRAIPNRHCLLRQYNKDDVRFYSSETMARFIAKTNGFEAFSRGLEGVPHGTLHVAIGGRDGDLSQMHSPNDPLFWLIHSSLDRMWYNWQRLESNRIYDFNGGSLRQGVPGLGVNVGQMLDYNTVCVTYQDYSGDWQLNINSLRARRSSGAEEPVISSMADVSGCLPPPLPDAWLAANNIQPAVARAGENSFHKIVTRDTSATNCSTTPVGENATDTTATTPGGSQSVTVTSTTSNTIPAWGVALVVLGACIVVLMGVVVFLALSTHLG